MIEKLMEKVFWIGVTDWGIRHFHGHEYSTHRGTTYNSYLVMDEKIAVVDTVWNPFTEKFMENVRSLVDPKKIDFIVANHAEPDHSGALGVLVEAAPQAKVVVSRKGLESIPGHYHENWNFQAVKTGDTIALGETTLAFVEAPMLHWPDSMFTYVAGRNLLLSNDAFGQHYATAFRFNDQVDREELYEEALKYYANILTPFSPLVTKKIEEVLALGLAVDMIAPSHGVIWRKDPLQIVHTYMEWAKQVPEKRAVILADTMWQATMKMAEAIGEGIAEKGIPYRIFNMALSDRNDVLTEVFRSGAVVVGSPCLNGGLLPTLTPVLEDLKGLKFRNKVGAAFGSYGWSGENVKRIEKELEGAGIPLAAPGVLARWQPGEKELETCRDLGRKVAEALR